MADVVLREIEDGDLDGLFERKAGFRITGIEISYASARGAEIEETILRLD